MEKIQKARDVFHQSGVYQTISFGRCIPARKILVLAPHPDDEVLGAGGSLLRQSGEASIKIVYITDGKWGIDNRENNLRLQESQSITSILPEIKQIFLNIPDNGIQQNKEKLTAVLHNLLKEDTPDLIYIPWVLDRHQDHETTAFCLAQALANVEFPGFIACYEIMFPLWANHTVDITGEMERKLQLVEKYKSQVERYNIKNIITALNRYRAELLRNARIEYAESFYVADKQTFVNLIEYIYEAR